MRTGCTVSRKVSCISNDQVVSNSSSDTSARSKFNQPSTLHVRHVSPTTQQLWTDPVLPSHKCGRESDVHLPWGAEEAGRGASDHGETSTAEGGRGQEEEKGLKEHPLAVIT